MSLFYYRPWAGAESSGHGGVSSILRPTDGLYYTRWGYSALLAITMLVGIVLNTIYLAGYWLFPRAMLEVPHTAIVSLAVRDLLVCLVVLPASLSWVVAGFVEFPGGDVWCKIAVFFDYYLLTVHPLLIIVLCLILYTRKVPPKLPATPQPPPHMVQSRMSARSGYASHRTASARPPSVSGSVQSGSRHQGFRKGFAKKDGSLNGSYAGSVTGSVSRGGRGQFSPGSQYSGHRSQRGPRASSPLAQLEEERYAESVDGELWELASMEYPGKNDGLDLDFDDDDMEPDEPRLREWLKYVVWGVWAVALGVGVPAVQQAQFDYKAPGCYFAHDSKLIVRARHSYIIQDPTVNLLVSSVIINYIVPGVFFIIMSVLLCTVRWTQDGKLNRFFKMTVGLCVMFLVARSPLDILQFIDIYHTAQGNNFVNVRPDQIGETLTEKVWTELTF